MCKEGKAGDKKRQRRGLLVFSELPSLPSAGSTWVLSALYALI
jgi:hypothetical protein